MKSILIVLLLIALTIGAGYYGLPILIEQETASMKSESEDLKQRVEALEEFVKNEQAIRKASQLPPDADFHVVLQSVNTISQKVVALEDSLRQSITKTNEVINRQHVETEATLQKKAEAIDKMSMDLQGQMQQLMFEATVAHSRVHILKIRVDLASKNLGTAKNELHLLSDVFERAKTSAAAENTEIIKELQAILKKAQGEVDTDLPAAINRIDLLWYELSKLLRED